MPVVVVPWLAEPPSPRWFAVVVGDVPYTAAQTPAVLHAAAYYAERFPRALAEERLRLAELERDEALGTLDAIGRRDHEYADCEFWWGWAEGWDRGHEAGRRGASPDPWEG